MKETTNVTKAMIMAAIAETNAVLAGTATESTVKAGFTHINKRITTQNKSLAKMETEIAELKAMAMDTNEKMAQIIEAIQTGKVGVQVPTIKNENKDQVNKQYNTTANEAEPIGSVIRGGKRVNVFAKCECCGEYIDSAKVYAYCRQKLSAALQGKVACHKCQGGLKAGTKEYPAVAPESKEELFAVIGSPISGKDTASATTTQAAPTVTKCECCGEAITNARVIRYNNARKLPMYCQPCQAVKGTNAAAIKGNVSPAADTPIKAACDFCGKEIVYKSQEVYLNQVDHAAQIGIPESHKHICGTCYRGGKHEAVIGKPQEESKAVVEEPTMSAEDMAAMKALEEINAQKAAMQAELEKQNEMIQQLMAQKAAKKAAKEARAKAQAEAMAKAQEEAKAEQEAVVEAKVEEPKRKTAEETKADMRERCMADKEYFWFNEDGREFAYLTTDAKEGADALGFTFRRNIGKAKKSELLVWLKDNKECTTYIKKSGAFVSGSYAELALKSVMNPLSNDQMAELMERMKGMRDVSGDDVTLNSNIEEPVVEDVPESCVSDSNVIDDTIMQLAMDMANGVAPNEESTGGFVPVGGVPSNAGGLVPLDPSKKVDDVEF